MDADAPETLTGGNTTPVVRIGSTVRREAGPWTPTVHALLDALRAAGVDEAPRAHGLDDEGREILDFVPGTMLEDADAAVKWSGDALEQAARLLRRLHDATAADTSAGDRLLQFDAGPWRSPRHAPAEVICHNDFAPYNLVVDGDRLVGIIDFDTASPGSRVWDLTYLAYRLVPFAEDAGDEASGLDPFARLEALLAAYGDPAPTPSTVLAIMVGRLDELADFTDGRLAETGRREFADHAAMYRRDAARVRALVG